MLKGQDRQALVEQGWVVVPQVVSGALIDKARGEVRGRLTRKPPSPDHHGPYMLFLRDPMPEALTALLYDSPAIGIAESLIAPGRFEAPEHVQVSLNIPPFAHRPGGPHVDGLAPPEPDGRPGTFTLLAGVFLTDQLEEDMGNLWVWPGSHHSAAAYLREQGPEALISSVPYPPVELSPPHPVTGRAGDLLLAHYLLGHNMGGNTSPVTREVIYFRLRREGHRERWRDCVRDPLLEFQTPGGTAAQGGS
jgi:ectoine hydroxylase-related dioxygenase (phytanoyl-CoA dioxygenase family)